MSELMSTEFYSQIKEILVSARNQVYSAANFAVVEAYWNIGKSIVDYQGGVPTAEYGARLLKALAARMTADFGKGFTVINLSCMRQFYLTFSNHHALSDKLNWMHYRHLMKVENEHARSFILTSA